MDGFDSYAEWLDVPVDRRPPNHYDLLGLQTGESDSARIRAAGIERSARVRRYCLGRHGAEATRLLGELGAAFACLADPTTKLAYDRQLRRAAAAGAGVPPTSNGAAVPPASSEIETPARQRRRRRAARKTADAGPPPVQQHVEASDDEAPPRRSPAGEKKLPAVARSYSWLKRRRDAASSGPARFTVAAAVLLLATCGAVWSTRHPPHEVVQQGADVAQVSASTAPAAKPTTDKPAERAQQPAPSKKVADAAKASLPSDRDNSDSSADRNAPRADGEGPTDRDPQAKDDDPTVRAPDDPSPVDVTSSAPTADLPETPAVPTQRTPVPAKESDPTDGDSVSPFIDQGGKHEGKKADVDAGQVDRGRILIPGEIWRLRTNDDPEWMEVTFEKPADAQKVEIFDPYSRAKIDRAVIEKDDGSTSEMTPRPTFYEAGPRVWNFGATQRRATRLWLRFHPTADGVVELAGVAVFDRMGQPQLLSLVRAVTRTPVSTKPPEAAQRPSAAKVDDGAGAEKANPVDPIQELARQELDIVRGRKAGRVAGYVTFIKNYAETKAAIEAVADLEQIITEASTSDDVKAARKLLAGLAERQKETPLGEAASKALSSTKY